MYKDFKSNYFQIPMPDVKRLVIAHMIEKMPKFNQDKGKAFSYFSVMARNKLIQENRKAYKKRKSHSSIDADESFLELRDEQDWYEQNETHSEFMKLFIKYWEINMTNVFDKKRDIDICNAIVQLMKRAQNIENFNKKALYLMIREMTGVKTQYITKVLKTMREYYENIRLQYDNTGNVDMNMENHIIIDGEVY